MSSWKRRLAWLYTIQLGVTIIVSCIDSVAAFDPLLLGQSVSFSGGNGRPVPPSVTSLELPTPVDESNGPILQNGQAELQQRRGSRPTRTKSLTRRPRNYWKDISNVDKEFRLFWSQLMVQIPKSEPPPIPNESLLRHTGRHNLRAAIVAYGGRELLSEQLGGARIIPGKWTEAVAVSPELQQLVQPRLQPPQTPPNSTKADTGNELQQRSSKRLQLQRDIPPWSLPPATSDAVIPNEVLENFKRKRWCHAKDRNRKGYWTLQQVIQELYQYLDDFKSRHGRPAVWMPRPSEIAGAGRSDLHQAFSRFGGIVAITQLAGLVPFREWYYFEGQYRMLLELKRYLDEFCNSNYSAFPTVLEMKRNGYDELHTLIQYYGGRKFVASRLGMTFARTPYSRSDQEFAEMQWGAFDLDFGIQLLGYVREDQLKQMPPMAKPIIAIPSRSKLLSTTEGQELDEGINKYGGYENVARRLGLAFFD